MSTDLEVLRSFLDQQRRQALSIIDGLSPEQLRRPVLPSGWTCLGMLQHLSVDERYWFEWAAAGLDVPLGYDDMPDPDNDWIVAPGLTPDDLVERYRDAIERADAALSTLSLDAPPVRSDSFWDDAFGWRGPIDVRWIVLHMIEETARHAGHLDAVRELIDGHTWT